MRKILFILFAIYHCTQSSGQYKITFTNTFATPPTTPYIKDYISQGRVSSLIKNNDTASFTTVFLFGIIKRISPSPFSITLKSNAQPNNFTIAPNVSMPLSQGQLLSAFGNFANLNNFDLNQVTLNEITDPNNPGVMKLPDGIYSICFFSRSDNGCSPGPFDCFNSDPGQGCTNTFTIVNCSQPQNGMLMNTTVIPPINPLIAQSISAGSVKASLQFTNPPTCSTQVRLYGKIERISPSPFSIALDTNFQQQTPITINPGVTQLTPNQLMGAFNNFNESNLVVTGIDLASIKDANKQIKLPDGDYRICFYAKYLSGVNASDPNLGCASFTILCNPINGSQIITRALNPINPFITQSIQSGNVTSSIQSNLSPVCDTKVRLFGKIERISPSPFSFALDPNFKQQTPITLSPGQIPLTPAQLMGAFDNFSGNNLVVTGIDLASIKDANNQIKLPDGDYRICFYARYINLNGTLGDYASDPNLGCGSFKICNKAGGAPQFTQPVNNANINSAIAIIQ